MSERFAALIGYMVCGILALVAVMGILGACIFITGLVGQKLFKDLRRVYSLFVIGYWLDRLERGGMRVFEKAEAEDNAARKALND